MYANLSRIFLFVVVLAASAAASAQSPATSQTSGAAATDAGPWRADDLIVAPQRGQSVQQLWGDRYACDAWAKSQSGYDSSRPAGGGLAAAGPEERSSYRNALIACLQTKGYSVREAAQPAPPPAAPPVPEAPPSPPPHYFVQPLEPTSGFEYRPLTGQIEGGYTVTQGEAGTSLRNGWNGGLGFTWAPIAALPLALRVDGSYDRSEETNQSRQLEAQRTGASGIFGHEDFYGGDADAQINLNMGPTVREYFFGGVGWYREQTVFKQLSLVRGVRCFFYCYPGYVPIVSTVARSTTDWLHSWNAGMGFEFALTPPASFFIEARYLRIGPAGNRTEFVPIRVGLRF